MNSYRNNENEKHPYQRYSETKNVLGFVTNIHDAVNYDIHLFLTPELERRYNNVIVEEYSYIDFTGLNIPTNYEDVNTHEKSKTYRCRLKSVGVNEKAHSECTNRVMCGRNGTHASIDVSRLIDRADGWVICNISDVDVYRRVLVDVIITVKSKNTVDLTLNYLYSKIPIEPIEIPTEFLIGIDLNSNGSITT